MSILKTHNLQSPDASSVNIALAPNAGMVVTGISTFSGGVKIPNNTGKLELGSSQQFDLSINGSGEALINTTGVLNLSTTSFRLRRASGSHYLMNADQGGGLYLYYNGSERLRTTDKGIRVGTGVTIETNGQATFTGIVTATSFVGNGAQLTGIVGGKFGGGATGIQTVGNVGIQTANMTAPDLVGAASSMVGLYIGDGHLLFSNYLNKSGGYYITTGLNALNAGPVTLGSTMTLDGTWVIV